MTLLSDVFDIELFNEMVEKKYVKIQTHPYEPNLRIANYTEQATWERVWNEVTLQCRGLIYDADTEEVFARPFSKFFNYEEPSAPKFSLNDVFTVTDKMDGSLGILYPTSFGYQIATRGSFMSVQARWATTHLKVHYPSWNPNPDWTYLFEIIYPENRIVVNYGDKEALVLLAAIGKDGKTVPFERVKDTWDGPVTEIFAENKTLREILEMPERENAEGFVLHHLESDTRIKIKYEDYKILHRFLTNTTEKHVWEILSSGLNPEEVFAAAPDEFHDWLKEVIHKLKKQFSTIYADATIAYIELMDTMEMNYTRKDFALKASKHPLKSYLFKIHDKASINEMIWSNIKPSGETSTVRTVSSDAD